MSAAAWLDSELERVLPRRGTPSPPQWVNVLTGSPVQLSRPAFGATSNSASNMALIEENTKMRRALDEFRGSGNAI